MPGSPALAKAFGFKAPRRAGPKAKPNPRAEAGTTTGAVRGPGSSAEGDAARRGRVGGRGKGLPGRLEEGQPGGRRGCQRKIKQRRGHHGPGGNEPGKLQTGAFLRRDAQHPPRNARARACRVGPRGRAVFTGRCALRRVLAAFRIRIRLDRLPRRGDQRGGRGDPVLPSPGEPLLRRKTAARTPAMLGATATATVPTAGKRRVGMVCQGRFVRVLVGQRRQRNSRREGQVREHAGHDHAAAKRGGQATRPVRLAGKHFYGPAVWPAKLANRRVLTARSSSTSVIVVPTRAVNGFRLFRRHSPR